LAGFSGVASKYDCRSPSWCLSSNSKLMRISMRVREWFWTWICYMCLLCRLSPIFSPYHFNSDLLLWHMACLRSIFFILLMPYNNWFVHFSKGLLLHQLEF
jgi:hypothetical protein